MHSELSVKIQFWFENFCNSAYQSSFYVDSVYDFKRIVENPSFPEQFRNEFNLWNVHGIMNTSGLLQSK